MRTRSQPMSPGGYRVLENHPRTRSQKKTTPQPSASSQPSVTSQPPAEPSSRRVTRSQDKKPDTRGHEASTESSSDPAETGKPKTTRAPRKKRETSKKTSRRVGKTKGAASQAPAQPAVSVEVDQSATTENEEAEAPRAPRNPLSKSKPAQRPIKTPVSRITRSQRPQPDQMEDNDATKGKEPEGGRSRRTREPRLRLSQADQNTDSDELDVSENLETETTDKENEIPNLSRKRRPSDPVDPTTPKRRNVGPPMAFSERPRRHVPFLTRRPFRPLSVAARERRRFAESSGRVDTTLFQLPRYVAQVEADRQEREAEPMNVTEPEMQTADEPLPQEPSTPETPRRGWNIRGLLDSVRPFSKYMPGLGLGSFASQPAFSEGPEERGPPEASRESTSSAARAASEPPAASAPLQDPAVGPSESPAASQSFPQLNGPASSDPESPLTEADIKYRKQMEEYEKTIQRYWVGGREFTYSLYPRPWDTRKWLESPKRTSKSASKSSSPQDRPKATPKPPSMVSPRPAIDATPKPPPRVAQDVTANVTQNTTSEVVTPSAAAAPQEKKRKRRPSPDVIPNPPGCSYGMYEEYFYIDDSDECEDDEESECQSRDAVGKTPDAGPKSAIRSEPQTNPHPSKKVRFDASPQDTPSKARSLARATDPYRGRHFIGIGEDPRASARVDQMHADSLTSPTPGTPGVESSRSMSAQHGTPTFGTPSAAASRPMGPQQIHTTTPNAAFNMPPATGPSPATEPTTDLGSVTPTAPSSVTAPNTALNTEPRTTHTTPDLMAPTGPTASSDSTISTGPAASGPIQSPTTRPTSLPPSDSRPETPSTPNKPEDEVVAKARSQLEKFKPKTPSGLRTASRYSSPFTVSPDLFGSHSMSLDFGEDQAGQDAKWLFELCPSGKVEDLPWPGKQSLVRALGVEERQKQLLVRTWNNLEMDDNSRLFAGMMDGEL